MIRKVKETLQLAGFLCGTAIVVGLLIRLVRWTAGL